MGGSKSAQGRRAGFYSGARGTSTFRGAGSRLRVGIRRFSVAGTAPMHMLRPCFFDVPHCLWRVQHSKTIQRQSSAELGGVKNGCKVRTASSCMGLGLLLRTDWLKRVSDVGSLAFRSTSHSQGPARTYQTAPRHQAGRREVCRGQRYWYGLQFHSMNVQCLKESISSVHQYRTSTRMLFVPV